MAKMSDNEIKIAIEMYQAKIDHLDPIQNADKIALYKSQIENLQNALLNKSTKSESTEQDVQELIEFYQQILENPELEPEKRILYMGELQRLQTVLEDFDTLSPKK